MPLTETNGKIIIKPTDFDNNIARTINSVNYSWQNTVFDIGNAFRVLPDNGVTATTSIATTNPELNVTINFNNSGTYYVWVFGYYNTTGENGVYYGRDGISSIIQFVTVPTENMGQWTWTGGVGASRRTLTITTPGTRTFHLWMRDAGFAVAKVILTLNPNFNPVADATLWRRQNIYQIITDRFNNGNALNDAATGGYSPKISNKCHGGDFRGIERKLGYIKSLGCTAIWFSPFVRNGLYDYHGYSCTDFYTVEPRMGTLADLQRLVASAHRLGIFVIADVVANHGSNLVDSSQGGWPSYRVPPNGYRIRYNNNARYPTPFDSDAQGVFIERMFHNNGQISNYLDDQQVIFGDLMVLDEFRTETPYIRQKMGEIWTYWMRTLDLDGFRVDTVKHVEMGFWDTWCPIIHAAAEADNNPNFFIFGETFDGNDQKVGQYTGTQKTGIYKFDGMADFPLYFMINNMFSTPIDSLNKINDRYTGLLNSANYDQNTVENMVTFLDNHDVARFLNQGGTTAHLHLALAFLYTTRGIPSLYYGTEQNFNGGADPANREDMFDGDYKPGTVTGENFDMTGSTYRLVNSLVSARRYYTSLMLGTFTSLYVEMSTPGLFAYARRNGNEEVIVILNSSNISRVIPQITTTKAQGTIFTNILDGSTVTVTSGTSGFPSMAIPPLGYRIFVSGDNVRLPVRTQVESVSPAYRAENVPLNTGVVITFNTDMSTSTVQSAFSITPNVTGTFSWSNGNKTMTFTPDSPGFEAGRIYTVKIAETAVGISLINGLTNSSQNTLMGEFETTFATQASRYETRPVINEPPSLRGLTTTSAAILVDVMPNVLSTYVGIEYGLTTSYGSTVSPILPPTGLTGRVGNSKFFTSITIDIGDLTAGTTYNYRIIASNSKGTTYSRNYTFTTRA